MAILFIWYVVKNVHKIFSEVVDEEVLPAALFFFFRQKPINLPDTEFKMLPTLKTVHNPSLLVGVMRSLSHSFVLGHPRRDSTLTVPSRSFQ